MEIPCLNKFSRKESRLKTIQLRVVFRHLICNAYEMTYFYMKCNTGLKWVELKFGTSFNSKHANTDGDTSFLCFRMKMPFLARFGPKIETFLV